MQIFTTLKEALANGRSAVACGYFDGLHIGHAAVVGRAVSRAAQEGLCPCVFTFSLHGNRPGAKRGGAIITELEKNRLLEGWGVSRVLNPDFSEFCGMSPVEFVDEILVRRLDAGIVCCGGDFRFGRSAEGDVARLIELCGPRGIEVDVVPEVMLGGERVSSTKIRALLSDGEVESAAALLGRTFGYELTVVSGKKLGRTIDCPTINQKLPDGFITPRLGVYASTAITDGKIFPAVTNIGVNPTVENDGTVVSETYLHGFSGDLYGKNVEVRLIKFLRAEQKFGSVAEMREQISHDIAQSVPIAEKYILTLPKLDTD